MAKEGGSCDWREPSLEERLGDLNLQGEEEEDLDLSGEFEELVKEVRWLAIFRVHTSKTFSHAALFSALRIAWAAAKEVTFKAVEGNLFLVQMKCLGDWNRLMDSPMTLGDRRWCLKNMMDSPMSTHTNSIKSQFGQGSKECWMVG